MCIQIFNNINNLKDALEFQPFSCYPEYFDINCN